MKFSLKVAVIADGVLVYQTHHDNAARLVRDGLATRKNKGRIELVSREPGAPVQGRRGNPQKYTFLEALGQPVTGHCHTLKPHIADPRNWPIYRAALVDCLPGSAQAEIRKIFAHRRAA